MGKRKRDIQYMDHLELSIYAMDTVHTSSWTLFKARLFGKKMFVKNEEVEAELVEYKGHKYLNNFKNISEEQRA